MTHEGDAAALRSGAEEGNLDLFLPQLVGVMHHGIPGRPTAGVFVVLGGHEVDSEAGIGLNNASEPDLQVRGEGRTKVAGRVRIGQCQQQRCT